MRLGCRAPTLTPHGFVRFEVLTSFPDKPNVIEASANLRDWTAIGTNTPVTNVFLFTEPFARGSPQRFFRVVLPPE